MCKKTSIVLHEVSTSFSISAKDIIRLLPDSLRSSILDNFGITIDELKDACIFVTHDFDSYGDTVVNFLLHEVSTSFSISAKDIIRLLPDSLRSSILDNFGITIDGLKDACIFVTHYSDSYGDTVVFDYTRSVKYNGEE